MIIKAVKSIEDIEKLKVIWEKFYKDDFIFPNFGKFLVAYLVEDNNGNVITGGGINLISEAVIFTDKSKNVNCRTNAIKELLDAGVYFSKKNGYDQIHASITDPNWCNFLENRFGFRPINGRMLVKDV